LNHQVYQILKDDYIKSLKSLTGKEITCMKVSTVLAVASGIFTGLGSVLAFSAGFFNNNHLSYVSGCTSVLAIIFVKASYYANSQSNYHDAKLKNLLTKEYKLFTDFVKDPTSLQPVEDPTMPDPNSFSQSSAGNKV